MKIDSAMIEEIVRNILKQLDSQSIQKPDLLVVNATEEDAIHQLENNWRIIREPATSLDTIQDTVFLHVSQDLLVKGALGITDSRESELLSQLLLQGKSIHLIPSVELQWMTESDGDHPVNEAYRKHLLTYKEKLESFGVKMQSFTRFARSHAEQEHVQDNGTFREKLLTEAGVKNCEEETIRIRKSTIVTPLARDTARDLGKSISVID